MEIRQCKAEDEQIWVELNVEFMVYEAQDGSIWGVDMKSEQKLRDTFQQALKNPEFVTLLLLEEDGRPVGFSNLVTFFSVWAHGKALVMDDLFLKEGCRGQGRGRAFMAYLEQYAKEAGYTRLQFQAEHSNPKAHAFYSGLGYGSRDMHFYVKYV